MKVFLNRKKSEINAIGEYNVDTKEMTVKKGSTVSGSIQRTEKFRGAATIEKTEAGLLKGAL